MGDTMLYRPSGDLRHECLTSPHGRSHTISLHSHPLYLFLTPIKRNPLPRLLIPAPFAPLLSKERKANQLRLCRTETAEKNEELADLT